MRKPEPGPVITMDDGKHWLRVDGDVVGKCYPFTEPITVYIDPVWNARDLRALADFLEQLEGANLLSGIREVGE